MAIDPIMVQHGNDLDAAFAALEQRRPDAIIVQPSLPTGRVAQLAIEHRLPAVSPSRGFVEAGGLISYWFDEADLYRNAAAIVDEVLKGTKPADVPVQQPTKFELVINLKTANALGLTVPQSLLARADEVIE
jgi:putative ABC transport system substrate-binding protein